MIARARSPREEEARSEASTFAYAPPDALRAARALYGLTMDEVAQRIGMTRKSLAACEEGSDATLRSIAALRKFYDRAGIEFLGAIDLTSNEVYGSGVCWKQTALFSRVALWPPLHENANFYAARALLGLEKEEMTEGSKLTARQIGDIERGRRFTAKGYKRLREFFEDEKGVEFLCSKMGELRHFQAAGVRMCSERVPVPSRLWVNSFAR
ncbi:helix-turn-helix domain-containing protein [Rhizobium ruizarguesonis]